MTHRSMNPPSSERYSSIPNTLDTLADQSLKPGTQSDAVIAEATKVLKEELPTRITDLAKQEETEVEEAQLTTEEQEVIKEADQLLAQKAEALTKAINANRHGQNALQQLIDENEAERESPTYWTRRQALDLLQRDWRDAQKGAGQELSRSVRKDRELAQAITQEVESTNRDLASRLDFSENYQGPSEKLRREEASAVLASYGAETYSATYNPYSDSELPKGQISLFETSRLKNDQILTDEYLNRASSENRTVIIGLDNYRKNIELPQLRSQKTLDLGAALIGENNNSLKEAISKNISLSRGEPGGYISRGTVNDRLERATDSGLTGFATGLAASRGEITTQSELHQQERQSKEFNGIRERATNQLETHSFDSKHALGFFLGKLDIVLEPGITPNDEQLRDLDLALRNLNQIENIRTNLGALYQDIESNPDSYPITVRQLLALNSPEGVTLTLQNEKLYGKQSERDALAQRLERAHHEAGLRSISEATADLGPVLIIGSESNQYYSLSSQIERSLKGYEQNSVTIEGLRRVMVLEQTQALIVQDIARNEVTNNIPTDAFAQVLREGILTDSRKLAELLNSRQPQDDVQKRATALLMLARLHTDTSTRYDLAKSLKTLTDATYSDGTRLISPIDLINTHNICLSRVDSGNRLLSQQRSGERSVDGLRFQEVISDLIKVHRDTHIRGSAAGPDIFGDYILLENRIADENTYQGVRVNYYASTGGSGEAIKHYSLHEAGSYSHNSPLTLSFESNQAKAAQIEQLKTGVDALSIGFELADSQKSQTKEKEASTEPVQINASDRGPKAYEGVLQSLGLRDPQRTIDLLRVQNGNRGIEAIEGFPSFKLHESASYALSYLRRTAADVDSEYQSQVQQKSSGMLGKWGSIGVSKQKILESKIPGIRDVLTSFVNEKGLKLDVQTLIEKRDPVALVTELEAQIDRIMSGTIATEINMINIETVVTDLRNGTLGSMFVQAQQGIVNVGNIGRSSGSYYGAGVPINRAPQKYATTQRNASEVGVLDLYPEAGITNQFIDQKIDGLNRMLFQLRSSYQDEGSSNYTIDRNRYPSIAAQAQKIETMIASLNSMKIAEVELAQRLKSAKESRIETIRERGESSLRALPNRYQRALAAI